jgi:hypothetical protein
VLTKPVPIVHPTHAKQRENMPDSPANRSLARPSSTRTTDRTPAANGQQRKLQVYQVAIRLLKMGDACRKPFQPGSNEKQRLASIEP